MEQIKVSNLTFSYSENNTFALREVSFSVKQGEILLVIGQSGCGKTTLLRHLKPDYIPQGRRGENCKIEICNMPIQDMGERERASLVGFVGQNADSVQVTDKVWHELAFGLESLGYCQAVMQRKIAEMTVFFGLENIYHEKCCNLSGGQKQLVNLASVMAMEPEILILDEPTSQLDPVAATEFFRMIEKINRELGTTVVMSEHRLEEVFSLCDRVLVMKRGKVIGDNAPERIAELLYREKSPLYKALPASVRIYYELKEIPDYKNLSGECSHLKINHVPLTVNMGRTWLKQFCEQHNITATMPGNKTDDSTKHPAFVADELWFRYEKDGKDVLKACSLCPETGKITAILGGNGAGKSTLLHVLSGLRKPYRGKIKKLSGKIGILPQNPQVMFVKKTVQEELEESGGNSFNVKEKTFGLQKVIDFCELAPVLGQHPFDLSGGQVQKLALAKLLLEDYDILLLDEPGKGMDYAFKEEMGKLLKRLAAQGKTIVMVSHDVEFCAEYADFVGLFFDGHIVSLIDARHFFEQNVFYTTSVVRMCRKFLPQAVVVKDVLEVFGADAVCRKEPVKNKRIHDKGDKEEYAQPSPMGEVIKVEERQAKKENSMERPTEKRELWIHIFIYFLVMPFTIYVGHTVLNQRKYYFVSLLLVIEAILSFFLSFENRKPKLREIMIVAVLSAITVAGRAAFYMLPNVKPMAALTILSGVGLGAETGFLVGAMSMLVSNIFFGQGPWTPWQMFSMGMLGFLAGVIFKQNTPCDDKKKISICVFGLLSVILIYGGIMNPASVLIFQEKINMEMILASWGMGISFDVIHGLSTFIFLLLGARPILEKLERVKNKYGFD